MLDLTSDDEERIIGAIRGSKSRAVVRYLVEHHPASSEGLSTSCGRFASSMIHTRLNEPLEELGYKIVYRRRRYCFIRVCALAIEVNMPPTRGQSHRWVIT